ncbi:unnamed protein product, partial [Brassica oleracea var. botrytis]
LRDNKQTIIFIIYSTIGETKFGNFHRFLLDCFIFWKVKLCIYLYR